MGQPLLVNDTFRVRVEAVRVLLAALEVPEVNIARRVATREELAIWAEGGHAGVARDSVASEALLAVLFVAVGAVDEDLIVQRLGCQPFVVRRQSHGGHRVHRWPEDLVMSVKHALRGVAAPGDAMTDSAMYLMVTGMSKSHARMVLSSEVVTNLKSVKKAQVNMLPNSKRLEAK